MMEINLPLPLLEATNGVADGGIISSPEFGVTRVEGDEGHAFTVNPNVVVGGRWGEAAHGVLVSPESVVAPPPGRQL